MADIVVTDADWTDLRVMRGCKLDVEIGDSGNDFELTVDASSGQRVADRALVYVDGTEYGGIVDGMASSGSDGTIAYGGRTWTGMLANKIIEPPSGQDKRSVSGDANAVLLSLVSLLDLSDVMTASTAPSGISVRYTFDRYDDGYSGIRKMLEASSARLAVEYDPDLRKAVLSAVPIVDYSDGPDSDRTTVDVTKTYRRVNHLISLGEGEGKARIVRHDYADKNGKVSRTQTLFGVDEITAKYDYTSADADRLAEDAPKKLKELQESDSFDVTVDPGWDYAVGDIVPGTDVATGAQVVVAVGTKIAKVTDREISIEYKAGGTAQSASLSGSSESSGGVSYSAGSGITIEGRTISADVDLQDLAEVEDLAREAQQTASNASSAAGARILSVTASSPLASSTSTDKKVSLSHAASGVSAGAYGPATDGASPGWGESFNVGPRVSVDATGHVTQAQGRSVTIPGSTATSAAKGLMSSADKSKLDGVESGANHTDVDAAISGTSANPVQNKAVSAALDGKSPVGHGHQIDDVEGLDGALAGKSPVGHTHSYAGSDEPGGAADSAKRLEAARTVTFTGAATGSFSFDGSEDVTVTLQGDSQAEGFLAAHPVGSVCSNTTGVNPGSQFGGTWKSVPSMGAYKWERTA